MIYEQSIHATLHTKSGPVEVRLSAACAGPGDGAAATHGKLMEHLRRHGLELADARESELTRLPPAGDARGT